MMGLEPRIYGFRSDRSANSTTTTAQTSPKVDLSALADHQILQLLLILAQGKLFCPKGKFLPNPVTLTGLDEKFAAKKVAIFHPSFVLIFLVVKARAKFDPSFEGGISSREKKGQKNLLQFCS